MSLAFWDVTTFANMRYDAGIVVLCLPAQAIFQCCCKVDMPPHLHGHVQQSLLIVWIELRNYF